ncbi:MAG: ABC transporter substrate-binding protein [Anaerolineales bacterium]
MNKKILIRSLLLAVVLFLAGCKSAPSTPAEKFTMRVGYFPNITHSQALIGIARGDFQKALGDNVTIQATVFNAGPSVIEALFAGQIDLSYIGPNPAINGYTQSEGKALRVVAGATSGGAAFVVRPAANIKSAADLAGKKLATPQLGNTQDVALRGYLAEHGLKTKEQGGNVEVVPTDNAQILDLFRLGQIDGAWIPEPWASRLVIDGGGTVFIDERDLWTETGGQFTTALIIVDTKFLASHPDAVKAWLRAHVEITQWELENPGDAQTLMNAQIQKLTGKALTSDVMVMAWSRMKPTWDPISASLTKCTQSAYEAGFIKTQPDLSGINDLTVLNQVLKEKNLSAVK